MKFIADYECRTPEVIKSKTVLGHRYTLTTDYLLKDDVPYIYTMGELHFSRMKEEDWEKELVKMKNGGIDIVSSYIFWNHHETEKGRFDFTGNRNLRKFIDLCEKLEMPFFLRLGPWAHGEARLGGFPDWLEEECTRTRCLDDKYLFYVERLYSEVYKQVATSGNIFGIQIENEYSGGPEYLQYLYDVAVKTGFDAFLFTATGWDDAVLPDCLVPVFGVYPEYPWAQHTDVFGSEKVYGFFGHDADRYWERIGKKRKYPVLTCELGGGNQSTYHRRPLIMPWEVASLTVAQLGTGCKGLGYYMYHGGINPVKAESDRIVSTFQESRESGYGNDCPVVSYDFQSPLGDCGQYRQSYFELKTLMNFVKCESASLAKMQPFQDTEGPEPQNTELIRASVLSDGESGFLFYLNCFHGHRMRDKSGTAIIKLKKQEISVPLDVNENGFGIVPFNYRVGSEVLRWVKAFPVNKTSGSVTFSVIKNVAPVYLKQDGEAGDLRETECIGGMKIILTETERPAERKKERLEVNESCNRLSFDVFRHIIPRKNMRLPDLTREYTAVIPENVSYVSVYAEGNLGAAFEEIPGKGFRLISDHFLDGDEWIVDVRGVEKLRLKIQPFREEDRNTVYLEKNFVTGCRIPEIYAAEGDVCFVNCRKPDDYTV